ncbi:APC family permease [Actinosynnema mirum]|uniref:Amino acid permease-associated region n=1 Tax=Actinosynnema mirum (strain ATCC 29888 / DSM 43827 / JCM 3225 / NBRC 14064 / NCIMB 13271 / NRRL B-12336 / IMRU 3971 / 101) TaxID=446462 RepID=C6WMV8_ACTMD|nr:APC family permease [Actinosynnema mirum]ACU38471.1 amino acid permease-associated region [Actinosynnema mirum DSM 43827]
MTPPRLTRRLGLGGATLTGLGAVLGAGVFAAFAPAARAAGTWLLLGLAIAAATACCNAASSARLAARRPVSGGAYVHGSERLGPFWGHLAGWGFVVGKTASCAAMALTAAAYALPDAGRGARTALAVAAVLAVTALTCSGVRRSLAATAVIVPVVLLVLALVVAAAASAPLPSAPLPSAPLPSAPHPSAPRSSATWTSDVGPLDVLESAGLLFFAFAGYARVTTLGEEVRDPARIIPRAVGASLVIALLVYAVVAVALLGALGPAGLASAADPLAAAASGWPWLTPLVRAGAALAALGSLLALVLGVSRTALAMARDGHLPRALAAVHPRHGVPHHAGIAVGVVVAVLVSTVDLRGAIGFSSFAVLVYYAIANASAWTLGGSRPVRAVAAIGLVGCLLPALALPVGSVVAGAAVLAVGALVRWWRQGVGADKQDQARTSAG